MLTTFLVVQTRTRCRRNRVHSKRNPSTSPTPLIQTRKMVRGAGTKTSEKRGRKFVCFRSLSSDSYAEEIVKGFARCMIWKLMKLMVYLVHTTASLWRADRCNINRNQRHGTSACHRPIAVCSCSGENTSSTFRYALRHCHLLCTMWNVGVYFLEQLVNK